MRESTEYMKFLNIYLKGPNTLYNQYLYKIEEI